jgi:hypothetical protein
MQNITNKIFIFGFLLCVLVFLAGLGYYLMQQSSETQLQRNFDFLENSGTMATELESSINGPVLADLYLLEKGIDRRHFFGLFIDKSEDGNRLVFMRSKDGMFYEDAVELMTLPKEDSFYFDAQMPKLLYNEDLKQWEAYMAWPGSNLHRFTSADGEEWKEDILVTTQPDLWPQSNLLQVQGLGYFAFTPTLSGIELKRGEDLQMLLLSDSKLLEIPIPQSYQAGQIRSFYMDGYYYLMVDMMDLETLGPRTLLARSIDLVSWQVSDNLQDITWAQITAGDETLLGHIDLLAWNGTGILYYSYLTADWTKEHQGFVKLELATLFSRFYQ